MKFNLEDLEEKYYLELDRVVEEIKSSGAERVLVQLPDGLKPYGLAIVDYLEGETEAKISIYLGDCFGACDLPQKDSDLLIQFGHAPWTFEDE